MSAIVGMERKMTRKEEIGELARKIKRDRRRGRLFSPLTVGFFVFAAWCGLARIKAHVDAWELTSLPKNATPDMIRAQAILDCIPVLLSFCLFVIATGFAVFLALKLFLPDRMEELVLRLAEEVDRNRDSESQPATAADALPRPAER